MPFEAKGVVSPVQSITTMSRTTINFLLDSVLLVAFLALIWCSVVLRFIFPPGPIATGWLLWGASYDQWHSIQFGLITVLAVGFLVHVMLHWPWVCNVVATRFLRGKKGKVDDGVQTLYGVGLLIGVFSIVGFGVAAASLMIQSGG